MSNNHRISNGGNSGAQLRSFRTRGYAHARSASRCAGRLDRGSYGYQIDAQMTSVEKRSAASTP